MPAPTAPGVPPSRTTSGTRAPYPISDVLARRVIVSLISTVALVASACGSAPPDRSEVLGDLARAGIVVAYERAADAALELRHAVGGLCGGGSAEPRDLTEALEVLARTRSAWLRTEAVWVGPVMERRSWALVDWPVDVDGIEQAIVDESVSTDAEDLATRVGADMRGLRTVEYLLGPVGNERATIVALAEPRRCGYLVAVTEVLTDELLAVRDSWRGEGDPAGYPEMFSDDPDGVDELVNDILDIAQKMINTELGVGIGAVGDGADLSAVVDGPSQLGVADLSDRLAGISVVLIGDEDQPGLSPLLDEDLTARINDQVAGAEEAIAAIEVPLARAVVDDPDRVATARDALKELQVSVGAEVVSSLGVTVGFSDADGDSAG